MKEGGIAAVADAVIAGWLTADFRERDPQTTAKMKAMLLATPVEGYLACCEALSTLDQRALLPEIKSPTLVIAGRHDMATPLSAGELIRSNIPRASLTHPRRRAYFQCRTTARLHRRGGRLPDATLTNNVIASASEASIASASAPRNDGRTTMDDQKRRDDGMAQRRKVLGNEWVDKSITNRNAFNTDFQDMITRYAWGEIWTRPHFDERTRRVLVIGTMVALAQWDEFRLHVRAALTEGGFTPDDIKEILLQQAIYCGVPAANHAVKEASAIIQELGLLKG